MRSFNYVTVHVNKGQRSESVERMSRVIVKNVPPKTTEKTLAELFSQCGEVTDAKLIRTRDGLSRRFGFVGLVSDAQAKRAVDMFDRSYIGASRITVEVAKPYGDESLQRPWSKYSRGSSAHARRERGNRKKTLSSEAENEGEREKRLRGKKAKIPTVLSEYYKMEDDDQFQEFLSVHTHKSQVQTWRDGHSEKKTDNGGSVVKRGMKRKLKQMVGETEVGEGGEGSAKVKKLRSTVKHGRKRVTLCGDRTYRDSAGESGCEDGGEIEGKEGGKVVIDDTPSSGGSENELRTAEKNCVTDMAYLQSKVVEKLSSVEESRGGQEVEEEGETKERCENESEEGAPANQRGNEFSSTMFTLRMRGLPFKCTKEDVEAFFHPLTLADVRFTVDRDGRPSGRAYVDFNSDADMSEALKRNGDCIGKRYIELFSDEGPQSTRRESITEEGASRYSQKWNDEVKEGDETIADSGRLFLRNLSYTVSEEDLTEAFEKYGPLTEVTIPLDKNTNRPVGLGFVTFMLPEHAVKAYESLDGQVFQGRLLHILPARPRQGRLTPAEDNVPGGSKGNSFKQKKDARQKSQAGSSHNWNTLFLGANAVVDAMAQRYSTQKSSILDAESHHSAAVRMALGETQFVSETREFLQSQGVRLDAFEQKKPKRSSTVILTKNLPHGTKEKELQELFSPFGSLHRVILPPSGISALVEFLESSHAKSAFKRLAYSKFKHLPLYLEWAPLDAVETKSTVVEGKVRDGDATTRRRGSEERGLAKDEEEGETTAEQCTLFVKNLNFATSEGSLGGVFSKVGGVKKVEIARKRNIKDPAHPLSMGFGFVEFSTPQLALEALRDLQHAQLDGHKLELKLSHRVVPEAAKNSGRKSTPKSKQTSAKIMIRNIPFEASQKEIRELFKTFGQLKTVRLPKKMATMGKHRGFGFVEFMTKGDARRAFESLCHSTHLYGRRLVLEWAEGEESVEEIRKRTAEHFHGTAVVSSKRRKAELMLYGNNNDDVQSS